MEKINQNELIDEIIDNHKETIGVWKQKLGDIENFFVMTYSPTSISNYFDEFAEMGELKKFKSLDDREEEIRKLKKSKKLFFNIEKYEHGSVDFSVADTKNYPDKRWDVNSLQYVFVPCDFLQDQYKKNGEKNLDSIIKDTNSILSNYSDWCNGQIFAIHTYQVKNGKVIEEESIHELIGDKYAQDTLKEMSQSFKISYEMQKERHKMTKIELSSKQDFKEQKLNIKQENLIKAELHEYSGLKVLALMYQENDKKLPIVIEMNPMTREDFDALSLKKTKGIKNSYHQGHHVKTMKMSELQEKFYTPDVYFQNMPHTIIDKKVRENVVKDLAVQDEMKDARKMKMQF